MYIVIILLFIAFLVWMCAAITRAWNKGASRRRTGAEAQAARHGGQYVLEWDGPKAQGAADGEFGPLLVEIPKKSGGDAARFYERGLTVGGKRVAYAELKDAAFIPGSGGGITPAQKMRNSSVLWLYRKKGSTIGIRDMSYRFDRQTMEAIQTGLGFRPQA
ncbi:hypothetical protein [uncultured Oscillibacter sp.]|uniref:hypothetical protein n=1 Tax=uncultured Oscillibacter sp. TaxID=876091 RepID=UPI00263193D9|nr:hypothetical protein [uncultured Oscillibacter sp.]